MSDKLNTKLNQELTAMNVTSGLGSYKLQVIYNRVDQDILKLSQHLNETPLKDPDEEIYFYKEVLPPLLALKIYYMEIYMMEVARPTGSAETIRSFYQSEQKFIARFFRHYGFYYGYYRAGMTQLDELWFRPDQNIPEVIFPEFPLTRELSMTSCGYLFAKFIAYERLQDHLNDLIKATLIAVQMQEFPVPAKSKSNNFVQTLFNLSVDQIGLGARAALDASIISGKSFQAVCEDLAPRISTKEKDKIAPGSLRSNAYTGEDVDKHTLIRYLEKMIRLIKEY